MNVRAMPSLQTVIENLCLQTLVSQTASANLPSMASLLILTQDNYPWTLDFSF